MPEGIGIKIFKREHAWHRQSFLPVTFSRRMAGDETEQCSRIFQGRYGCKEVQPRSTLMHLVVRCLQQKLN